MSAACFLHGLTFANAFLAFFVLCTDVAFSFWCLLTKHFQLLM
jgi:hypothetical protein